MCRALLAEALNLEPRQYIARESQSMAEQQQTHHAWYRPCDFVCAQHRVSKPRFVAVGFRALGPSDMKAYGVFPRARGRRKHSGFKRMCLMLKAYEIFCIHDHAQHIPQRQLRVHGSGHSEGPCRRELDLQTTVESVSSRKLNELIPLKVTHPRPPLRLISWPNGRLASLYAPWGWNKWFCNLPLRRSRPSGGPLDDSGPRVMKFGQSDSQADGVMKMSNIMTGNGLTLQVTPTINWTRDSALSRQHWPEES